MDKEIPLSKLVKMSYDEIHAADKFDLFYDWFSKDSSLPNKSKRLMSAVRAIVKTGTKLFDPDKTYVFFKNNCSVVNGLYDDLHICDIESGAVLFNICPSDPHSGDRPRVAFNSNDGKDRWNDPLVFNSMKDLKAWFKDPTRFKTSETEVYGAGSRPRKMKVSMCKIKAEAKTT